MLIGDVANLSEHPMFVLVAITSLDLHRVVALFLFPLLVTFMIYNFVAILVRIKLVVLVILVMLNFRERVKL